MRTARLFLLLAGSIFLVSFIGLFLVTFSLYRNVDEASIHGTGSMRAGPLIANLHEQLHQVESAEQLQQYFKVLESAPNSATYAPSLVELKKTYAPLVAHLQNKPKENEARYTLLKKKDFLDGALNFYRKEAQSGDIPVRALLLNIVFDTHSSFLGESPEMEMVFIKKCKEHVAGLKAIANEARSAGIGYRISGLENLLSNYERAATQAWNWNEDKKKILADAEKSSAAAVQAIVRGADVAGASARRDFLQDIAICGVVSFLCLGILYFGSIKIRSRFEFHSNLLRKYFSLYGQEKFEVLNRTELALLKNDGDWSQLFNALQESEEQFQKVFEGQRAVSQFCSVPFLVTNKNGDVVYWNMPLKDFFNFEKSSDIQGRQLTEVMRSKAMKNSFSDSEQTLAKIFKTIEQTGVAEVNVQRKNSESIPVELIVSSIGSGKHLEGGRVIFWRKIPNEAARVQEKLSYQLSFVRQALQDVSLGKDVEVDFTAVEGLELSVREALDRISTLKGELNERELSWKEEIRALLEQVGRQHEILQNVSTDLSDLRARYEKISHFFAQVFETEKIANTELNNLEKNLEAWSGQQSRLQLELSAQLQLLERARDYEKNVRTGIQQMRDELIAIAPALNELKQFREDVRLKALNLSLGREPGSEQFAARVRGYAVELDKLSKRLENILSSVRDFVDRSPGSALFTMLQSGGFDVSLFEDFRRGQSLIGESVSHWKNSTDGVLKSGTEVQEILADLSEKSEEVHKLNETCLVINESAKENLARWN